MTSLGEAQHRFVDALRRPGTPPPPGVKGRAGEAPEKRFNVYRNNVHVSLVEAIRAIYPIVERLVGEAFFHAMARAFVAEELPRSPLLFEYGDRFPAFIRAFEPAHPLPYLEGVARLEWAQHEAYHAADAPPLAPEALADIAPEKLAKLRLELHPALRVVAAEWPIYAIWETNAHDDHVRRLDLNADGEEVLVVRPALHVITRPMAPGGSAFIEALAADYALPQAAETAALSHGDFDLAGQLGGLLSAGGVTGYRIDA